MANKTRTPWAWIPSLYFAEGLPYVVVMTVSVIMYKRLGISNTDIALYTSWLYLPWVIKPFWSPLVDLMKTKRWWITIMQLFIGAGLAGIALTIPAPSFFQYTLAFFWLMAFSSATHDIAADGFYMLGLDEHQQAFFVGIRSTFYRLAMITGQGLLIILAGSLESRTGLEPVRFEVRSSVNQTSVSDWNIESETFNAVPGAQKFILSSEEISISTQNISSDQANELKQLVKRANLQNMFIEEEKPLEAWFSIFVVAVRFNTAEKPAESLLGKTGNFNPGVESRGQHRRDWVAAIIPSRGRKKCGAEYRLKVRR
jgi:MFS transporter, PAT family, beta-lactamase induction signal transducer AmpG